MQELLEVMQLLRGPKGCPWDRQQTHDSLAPYLLEEAAEAVDAIAGGDADALTEELGDVLLQIAFHVVIAEETGRFDYRTIEERIVGKLIERHPHVFGDTEVSGPAEVVTNWNNIKERQKRDRPGQAQGAEVAPRSLPALMRAAELGRKLGWDAGTAADIGALLEQPGDLPDVHVGKLLLAVTDYARALDVNPELALRRAADARASLPQAEDDP